MLLLPFPLKNFRVAVGLAVALLAGGAADGAVGAAAPRTPETIVATICATCHGPALTGLAGPNLLDTIWNHGGEDADVLKSIRDGWPMSGMPPMKDLVSDEEQIAMVAFLRQQRAEYAAGRIKPPPPPPDEPMESEHHAFRLETVAANLDTPWGLSFLPDGRLLVTERLGTLRIVSPGGVVSAPIAGTPKVYYKQDGGMLDVIAHPDYAKNGWIYLAYTELDEARNMSGTMVVRGRIAGDKWVDQKEIFRTAPEFFKRDTSHYGCRFLWDAGRHLYFTIGERGSPEESQDLASPLGKIHRVLDDGAVPPDNPFATRAGALGSIWSYGHRHPQGLQFHPVTGKLWATEHGPTGGDELNRIEPGHNYGWPIVSAGTDEIRKFAAAQEGMDSPLAWWTPSIAPSGLTFYTGDKFPRWKNSLFVACLIGQQLRRIETDGDRVVHQEVVFKGLGRVRHVINGPDGLLYVALNSTPGRVVRIVPVATPPDAVATDGKASVRRGVFGRMPDGSQVESFTLANGRGSYAKIITVGAILAELRVPDRQGTAIGVVFESVPAEKSFQNGFPTAAAVTGRVANRIANARFTLDGHDYALAANAAPHHIHGGRVGFSKRLWRAEVPAKFDAATVTLTYFSPDGEEGYPGNLTVSITYTLTADHTLRLAYSATTDQPTILNLTNHAYFNLTGGGDVNKYEVEINADRYTLADDLLIPTGEYAPVKGTPLDFTSPTPLGARFTELGPRQIYDHNFVINRPAGDASLSFAARVSDARSGRVLEAWTTQPGVQLYTSRLHGRLPFGTVGFFCLETQHYPDSIHHPEFPSTVLRPGERFSSTTEYRFSVK